ncbi:MAG: vitamin B12-dependent ribonucleotide reductase [Dehalococcoidia bacterium]|nr:vitamin B12-dependent ribonucleotide reductase [Dehalococcoidia bacterium]
MTSNTEYSHDITTLEVKTRVKRALEASGDLEKIVGSNRSLSDNSLAVLDRRYLAKDREGTVIEEPDEMFRRVAHNLAQADRLYGATEGEVQDTEEEFYRTMTSLDYLPNSPTLMNAGRELQMLSACFVLPVDDSMEAIFETVKQATLVQKSGGGTGFAFSRLRPEGDIVGSTGGVASGPVSFMRAFDGATEAVKQGSTRRGANMGILRVNHPDILKFITSKEDGTSISNFNISVAVTEEFMAKVEKGEEYDLVNPRTGKIEDRLNARDVFKLLVQMAWKTGDPGIVFLDRINRDNPTPNLGVIESTNPCGEQPLLPYESCNLGSVNLAQMVRSTGDNIQIDWDKMAKVIAVAVHTLENVIDMNDYPIQAIEDMSKKTRRIGLGVMGFADLLIQLGIPYASEAALGVAEEIMTFIQQKTHEASASLAERRGTFPAWPGSIYDRPDGPLMRNSAPTTIAPTGTISIIAGCSSGIEPLFALSYVRNVMDNTMLVEGNSIFESVAKHEGFYSMDLMEELAHKGSLHELNGAVPDWVKDLFATSHDISPEWHVKMQAAFQRHTDNAVSKTINFPNDATQDDIADAYMLAYKMGCKGITIYRDGSKENQVLSTGEAHGEPDYADATDVGSGSTLTPRERPSEMLGITERIKTGHGTMYITINFDEDKMPFEVFSTLGKAGGCDSAQLEAISRLVSLALRSGVDIREVVSQLKGITCCPAWDNGALVRSAPDAVALALERRISSEVAHEPIDGSQLKLFASTDKRQSWDLSGNQPRTRCPDCNAPVAYQEGCLLCASCGWNKCG